MIKRILAVVSLVILMALGFVAYSFLKTPEEASDSLEAIPLVIEEDTPSETSDPVASDLVLVATKEVQAIEAEASRADESSKSEAVVEADEAVETETSNEEVSAPGSETATEIDEVATQVDEEAEPSDSSAEVVGDSNFTTFEIVPASSEARFVIGEILRGSPFTVIGATDQVAAEFAIDPADLSAAQIGPILINARTLATDNNFRNRALKNRILTTDAYEFINFTPTEIIGLNGSGTVGESFTFQVMGDLTIRDMTQPVTFETTATALSESQVEGFATATILYKDFNLSIPNVPQVAGVDEEVVLEIDFVATAKEQPESG